MMFTCSARRTACDANYIKIQCIFFAKGTKSQKRFANSGKHRVANLSKTLHLSRVICFVFDPKLRSSSRWWQWSIIIIPVALFVAPANHKPTESFLHVVQREGLFGQWPSRFLRPVRYTTFGKTPRNDFFPFFWNLCRARHDSSDGQELL